jgi:PAS domain S-box-containing protein
MPSHYDNRASARSRYDHASKRLHNSETDDREEKMTENIPRQSADRRQLQQIIAGLTEGVILIDPDRSIVWANETALAIHGVETLAELGDTVDDYCKTFTLRYRNNHILSHEQYPIERVLVGELFHDVIVEVTRTDQEDGKWVHQVRSLILGTTIEQPESLVLVLRDMTERFGAEDRFEKTFNANPAPAIICRLSDLRYVKVNQGFLEMTGYSREEVIGRSTYEIDILEQAERKEQAVNNLRDGRTIPQMEALLKLPGGSTKFVVVAGQPIEIGEENCMLFTFMDLEPRKKAEDALRQSEERFSKAFRLAPVPMTVTAFDNFRILDVNDAFTEATGYASEEVVGHDAAELNLLVNTARRQMEQVLEKANSVRNFEIQMRTKDGVLIDCLVSAETATIHGQRCILSVFQDITERKRSEVELIAAIETVMQDTSWFSRTVIEKLAQIRQPNKTNKLKGELADLTSRELEVLGLICQGQSDDEISKTLKLSRNTVRNHVSTIYNKIDVHRRGAAIVWARERGIIGYEAPKARKTGRTRSL